VEKVTDDLAAGLKLPCNPITFQAGIPQVYAGSRDPCPITLLGPNGPAAKASKAVKDFFGDEKLPFGRKPAVDLEGSPVSAAKNTAEAFPQAGKVEVAPKGGAEPHFVDYDPNNPQALDSLRPGDTVTDVNGQGWIKNEDGTWKSWGDEPGGGDDGIIRVPVPALGEVKIPPLTGTELTEIYYPPGVNGPLVTGVDISRTLGAPRGPEGTPIFDKPITIDDLADDQKALSLLKKVFKLADARRIGFERETYSEALLADRSIFEKIASQMETETEAITLRRQVIAEKFELPSVEAMKDLQKIADGLSRSPNPEVQRRAEVISSLLEYWLNEAKIFVDSDFVDNIYSRVRRNPQGDYSNIAFGTYLPPKVTTETLVNSLIDNGLSDINDIKAFDIIEQYLNFRPTQTITTRYSGSNRGISRILLKENRNLDDALIYAQQTAVAGAPPITIQNLMETQYLLTEGLIKDAGYIRRIEVNIGGTSSLDVPRRLWSWLDELNRTLVAVDAEELRGDDLYIEVAKLHYDFVKIHPFTDGNGRMARIVANIPLARANEGLFYVPVEDKAIYINFLKTLDLLDPSSSEYAREIDLMASQFKKWSKYSSFTEIASNKVTPLTKEDIDSLGVVGVVVEGTTTDIPEPGVGPGTQLPETGGGDGGIVPVESVEPGAPEGIGGTVRRAVGEAGERIGETVNGVREKILPSKIVISEPEWNEKTIRIDGLQTEVDNLVRQAKEQGMSPGTKITISYFGDDSKLKTVHTKLETLATAIRSALENNQFGTSFGDLSIKFGNSGIELGSVSRLSDPQNIVLNVRDIPTKAELNYLITHSADFRKRVALVRDIGVIGFAGAIGAAIGTTGYEISMYYFYYKPTTDKVPLKDPEAALRDTRNLPPNDYSCIGNQIVEVSATTGEVLKTLETCQSGCSSGMCRAGENAVCQPGEQLRVSDSSESCSLSCVDGTYTRDFAQCGSIDLNGISTNRYREVVMRTLNILPDDFFPVEKFDKLSIYEVPLAHFSKGDIGDFSPEVNWRDQEIELNGMASQTGEHLLIGREALSEGLVSGVSGTLIHELLHLWESQTVKPLPEGVPYSLVASMPAELLSGGAPFGYSLVTGCLDGGPGSAFYDKQIDVRAVNCGEDFAYAGTQYVLEACQLKSYSPERYEYFKNEVFRGQEYIPKSGCLSQGG
jgi:hypothetical protein